MLLLGLVIAVGVYLLGGSIELSLIVGIIAGVVLYVINTICEGSDGGKIDPYIPEDEEEEEFEEDMRR